MIQLTDVTKSYDDTNVVDHLNLQIASGEIIGLIGHNGAGKSTTLKMIAGLIEPTSGRVQVMGHDMQKESIKVKQKMGYLPEESPLYEAMTAQQYLLFFSELYRMPHGQALKRIDQLLDSLGLPDKNKLTGEFSKGMKRKTAIARTLLHDPELLILDEPNSGLDPLTSFFIINYLTTLKREGKTIILSAHNLFHVETICDRVGIIKNGKLLVFDTMDVIRSKLGKREYQVVFQAGEKLDAYEYVHGSYIFRTGEVDAIARMLEAISVNGWTLTDLSMRESALEEIYVKLMTNGSSF
jgi:ABC-2 type transport system ATP-binding protein